MPIKHLKKIISTQKIWCMEQSRRLVDTPSLQSFEAEIVTRKYPIECIHHACFSYKQVHIYYQMNCFYEHEWSYN